MIATLVSGFIPARRATQVEPVEAMREAATPGPRASAASGWSVSPPVHRRSALVGAARRPVRRRRRLGRGVAARPRRRGDDLRRRAARARARPPARALHRQAARALPGRAGPAGARERRAPAAAHRDHGLGADDRARARGVHGDLRRGPARLDRQGRRRAASAAPRSSSRTTTASPRCRPGVAEQLRGVPGVDVVSPMRFDQANIKGGGDSPGAAGVDPHDRHAAVEPELAAGDRTRGEPPGRPDDGRQDAGPTTTASRSATRSRSRRRPASSSTTSWSGSTTTRSACSAQILVTNASMSKDWNQPDDAFILVGGHGQTRTRWSRRRQARSSDFPVGEGADARAVQGRAGRPGQPAARARLRAAVAVGHRRAARDRQHAGAGRARAHARARPAARGRHEQAPGAPDGPRRVGHHGADRRGARARARRSCSP